MKFKSNIREKLMKNNKSMVHYNQGIYMAEGDLSDHWN